MSKFHASIRDILEDVHRFLVDSLQKEIIASPATAHKERLIGRLKLLEKEYPELQLNFTDAIDMKTTIDNGPPSSPIPYVDMNGGSPYRMPFFSTSEEKDTYDVCIIKDKYDSVESQSVTESEDYITEEAKNLPDIAAIDLYACEKSGYLDQKKRESIKGWLSPFKKRWCAIKDGVLYYYEKTSDRKQKGCIILSGYDARALQEDTKDGKKYNHCFELVCPGRRTYQFSAPSEKDLEQWIAVIDRNSRSFLSGKSVNKEVDAHKEAAPQILSYDHDDTEDIYETVEDEEFHDENEKESLEIINTDGSNSFSSAEELNHDQIFNYNDWYVGLWDCSGTDETELSFYRGDLIHIINKDYDTFSWWIGELQGKIGFVPKSYLMEAYEAC